MTWWPLPNVGGQLSYHEGFNKSFLSLGIHERTYYIVFYHNATFYPSIHVH